jgi:putative oxidoreductase
LKNLEVIYVFDNIVKKFKGYEIMPLRILFGLLFLYAGIMKAMSLPTGMLENIGFPAPAVFAVILMLVELIGGAALILGFYRRFFAAALSIMLIVALLTVHLGQLLEGDTMAFLKVLAYLGGTITLILLPKSKCPIENKFGP